MKTNIQTKLGMLGLLGVLALNSSFWRGQQIFESGDFASRSRGGNAFERCIRDATNKPHYSEELLKCEDRDRGLTVTVNLRDTTRPKDSRHNAHRTSRGGSVLERLGHSTTSDTTAQPPASQEQVRSAIAKITVAKTTVRGCNNCEKKTRSEELFRDIEGGNRQDFSDDPEVFAGQLIDQVKDLSEAIDEDLKEYNREKRREEKIAREWKLCKKDEKGYEFEDESDLNSCFMEQLANLKGRDLQNFINTRYFPHLMNMAFTNPEVASELRGFLADNADRGGANGALLKASLANFDSFSKDFSQRQRAIRDVHQAARTLPSAELQESFINTELKKINQTFSNYASQRMGHEASLNPALAPQFELIDRTLTTGRPPQSLWADLGSVSGPSYSSFSEDIARRSLGLEDLRHRILDVYPEYSRTSGSSSVPSRAVSLDRTAGNINSLLRQSRR